MKKIKYLAIGILSLAVICGLTYFLIMHALHAGNDEKPEEISEAIETETLPTENAQVIEPEFPDTRVFNDADADFQPEGAEQYEVDEAEPLYHVTVENLEEMYKVYDDYANCVNLKYYLDMYFLHFTGDDKARYVVTLTDGTCVDNEYGYLTLDATCDVYPDITLHIQYDKLNKVFGIKSELGDLSMEAQIESLHGTDENTGGAKIEEITSATEDTEDLTINITPVTEIE